MSLNLKTEEGKAIFFKLARKTDIIIEGFRPGVVRKLGIDYDAVKEVNPKIIYCAITGYGQSGPNRDRAGHDINYLSTTGILPLMGDPQNIPEVPRVQLGDIAAGGMNAAIGILMALHAREKTGKGQFIDISMSDGLLGFLSFPLNNKQRQEDGEQPVNSQAPESFACYHTYETSDGRCISIGAVEKRFWEKLCLHLNAPQYIDLQYSEERADEILEFMKNRFREKPADEWENELNPLDVCFSKVQTLDEVLCDPFFRERDMVVEMERENGGKKLVLGIPIRLSETPGTIRSAPKQFGESTIAILKEVGYSEEKIEELAGMDVF